MSLRQKSHDRFISKAKAKNSPLSEPYLRWAFDAVYEAIVEEFWEWWDEKGKHYGFGFWIFKVKLAKFEWVFEMFLGPREE